MDCHQLLLPAGGVNFEQKALLHPLQGTLVCVSNKPSILHIVVCHISASFSATFSEAWRAPSLLTGRKSHPLAPILQPCPAPGQGLEPMQVAGARVLLSVTHETPSLLVARPLFNEISISYRPAANADRSEVLHYIEHLCGIRARTGNVNQDLVGQEGTGTHQMR